jgi:hypothetical protein
MAKLSSHRSPKIGQGDDWHCFRVSHVMRVTEVVLHFRGVRLRAATWRMRNWRESGGLKLLVVCVS